MRPLSELFLQTIIERGAGIAFSHPGRWKVEILLFNGTINAPRREEEDAH